MSSERGLTTADLIAELVSLERERDLLRAMNEGFTELAKDPQAMAAYRAQQSDWEATLPDGLT
jgi:broad specificity phosphatase PhoE